MGLTNAQIGVFVIFNRPRPFGRANSGPAGWVVQMDREGFVRLDECVAVDRYLNRSAGVAGIKRELTAGRLIITPGACRSVDGRIVNLDGAGARRRKRYGEGGGGRAAVAFCDIR